MRKNIKWIISILFILLFLVIALYIIRINDNIIDKNIYNIIIKTKSNFMTTFFKIITSFASVPALLISVVIVLLIKKLKTTRFIILINLINDVILNLGLKNIFRRERPLDIMLVKETGYSFPSGHTMASCIFYGFIIYLIYNSKLNKNLKIILITILSILILLIGISRIYLGVHYPTDVIAGYLISISYLIIFTNFVEKLTNKNKQ